MGSEQYCLRWNNHQSNLLGVFSQLLRDESLVDVTLACSEGHSIRAHKVVLSACSSYFQTLFVDHPSRHPIVILKDVRFSELRTLVEFMYKGEVNVEYCQLSALLKTAESLKVKGLAEMTREYKPHDDEQLEPKVLVNRRQTAAQSAPLRGRSMSPDDIEEDLPPPRPLSQPPRLPSHPPPQPMHTEVHSPPCNSAPQNLRVCKSPPSSMDEDSRSHGCKEEEPEEHRDGDGGTPPLDVTVAAPLSLQQQQPLSSDCGASDMSIRSNSVIANPPPPAQAPPMAVAMLVASSASASSASSCSNRLPSPMNCEPVPGPSNLPPVQQVPLSLKKEVDWGGGEDKSPGEGSSDYNRQDAQEACMSLTADSGGIKREREGSPRLYPCMYCGNSFPHQSKLTRHILSHSLETLKYREQQRHAVAAASAAAAASLPPLGEPPLGPFDFKPHGRLPHEPPDPTDQPPTTALDLEEAAAAAATASGSGFGGTGASGGGGVVLCKFCGKSFPDVGSLIGHLPVHTGDRPFKCEFCGKAFKLRHHMKDHCRVHTGERPFRCALCGKTFSRSTILKAHEKTHYPKYVRKFLSPSPLDTEEENPPH